MKENNSGLGLFEKFILLVMMGLIVFLVYKLATDKPSADFQLCRDNGGIPIPSNWDSTNLSRCDILPR